ncbi:MAG: hypothetical protein BGO45_03720 [Microbacterium sp. 71-36]|nr:MAG: hypothetical protein ABS60_00505 [Microbacterium sp. SCN 71-17]OJV74964.1 MAG: hypothetical protein BGO45_03720 [Microbacterium sp. 71-36]
MQGTVVAEHRSFPLATSIELAHAWTSWLLEQEGIRALFIKGPGLAHHGLRQPRVSSDVDVLVAPAQADRFVEALRRNGWAERKERSERAIYVSHSVTLVHESWPCDIDVHHTFPGFLADPQETFDTLWARRVALPLARREVPVPDRLGSLLIASLHALRSRSTDPRHRRELDYLLTRVSLSEQERLDLAALAISTGCDRTLRTVLTALDVPGPADPADSRGDAVALREWELRVAAGASTGYMWLTMLRRQHGLSALRTARSAIWPSRAELSRMRPDAVDSVLGRLRARTDRLVTGLPGAISAARLWWSTRRSEPGG